jgi:hypothetical protein
MTKVVKRIKTLYNEMPVAVDHNKGMHEKVVKHKRSPHSIIKKGDLR